MLSKEINEIANRCVLELLSKKLKISTAESCTGGLIAASITDISGASEVFETGVVTYANKTKEKLIGVKHQTLESFGAVSKETAKEMANGVLKLSSSDISVSVTGIAGPNGGTLEKPVGLVYIAVCGKNGTVVIKNVFKGNREEVRMQTVNKAFEMILSYINNNY